MTDDFVRVAAVDEVADGEVLPIVVDGEDLVLARVGHDYYAVAGVCSHAFGLLDQGTLRGYELECPIHMGRFDVRDGHPTRAPADAPIATYQVRIERGEVLVRRRADS